MKVTTFSEAVAVVEGLKVQINIAQIKEILKAANKLTNGEFYKLIKKLE